MSAVTERLPILVTKSQKESIARRTKAANMTMGEFIRRAAESYTPGDDAALLNGLLAQVRKTTEEASAAIDDALSFVAASNKRIAKIEAGAAAKRG